MDVTGMTDVISNVGFPIFVAVWMLWKTSKDSENVVTAITELKNVVTVLCTKMDKEAE